MILRGGAAGACFRAPQLRVTYKKLPAGEVLLLWLPLNFCKKDFPISSASAPVLFLSLFVLPGFLGFIASFYRVPSLKKLPLINILIS